MVDWGGSDRGETQEWGSPRFFGGEHVAYTFKWAATFLLSSISPLVVRGEVDHGTAAELASKISWAIGTTLEIPYKKHSTLRDDCKYLANFIIDNQAE